MGFVFRTAEKILFGAGESRQAPRLAAELGRRVLLVTGAASLARRGTLARFEEELGREAEAVAHVTVPGEPDIGLVDEATRRCLAERCDVVLGVGGGSVLDTAKAVASLARNGGVARDYLEDVGPGGGRPITQPSLPTVLVPTTAGTGAEVTRNSVLRVPDRECKRSMRSDRLLPRLAIVDPELSATAPRAVAAAAGMDALTHLFEAYVSRAAQPLTDALAVAGIRLAMQGLRALAETRVTPETSAGLALASLYGGMALANAGLGAAHGLAAPLGGRLGVPHGVACAAVLPGVIRVNVAALRARAQASPALGRHAEAAALVVAAGEATPERAAAELESLRAALGLPAVGDLGLTPDAMTRVLAESRGGSMKANPVPLEDAELERILRGA